jgi:hypothetical protein
MIINRSRVSNNDVIISYITFGILLRFLAPIRADIEYATLWIIVKTDKHEVTNEL